MRPHSLWRRHLPDGWREGRYRGRAGVAGAPVGRGRQLTPAGKLGLRTSICQDLLCGRVAPVGGWQLRLSGVVRWGPYRGRGLVAGYRPGRPGAPRWQGRYRSGVTAGASVSRAAAGPEKWVGSWQQLAELRLITPAGKAGGSDPLKKISL